MEPLRFSTPSATQSAATFNISYTIATPQQSDNHYMFTPPHRGSDNLEGSRFPQEYTAPGRPSQCERDTTVSVHGTTTVPSQVVISSVDSLGTSQDPVATMAHANASDGLDEIFLRWDTSPFPCDASSIAAPDSNAPVLSLCVPNIGSFELYRSEVGSEAQNQASLKRRKSTHSSHTQFACTQCSKTFTRKKNLDDHIRRHQNSKLFACFAHSCFSRFNTKSDLVRHLRVVHKSLMKQKAL